MTQSMTSPKEPFKGACGIRCASWGLRPVSAVKCLPVWCLSVTEKNSSHSVPWPFKISVQNPSLRYLECL